MTKLQHILQQCIRFMVLVMCQDYLSHLPIQNRSDAAITISYEALSRIQDPVYGCVAHIYALQQQVYFLSPRNFLLIVLNCGLGGKGLPTVLIEYVVGVWCLTHVSIGH